MIWLTIDVEEVTDMNFTIKWKNRPLINYEKYIDQFIVLSKGHKTTAFVLGSFAKKHPHLIKKLSDNDIEIACHGYKHNLVYKEDFTIWHEEINEAKKLLEEIIGKEVLGYRSPSWSMPFEKKYYAKLKEMGFEYSSSYFPMKNYMYGNSINKKQAFNIYTEHGTIQERPIAKNIIPFSGGFYLRVLPLWILKILFKKSDNTIMYIHPYELMQVNLLNYFRQYANINIDYILAFYSSSFAINKIKAILKNE